MDRKHCALKSSQKSPYAKRHHGRSWRPRFHSRSSGEDIFKVTSAIWYRTLHVDNTWNASPPPPPHLLFSVFLPPHFFYFIFIFYFFKDDSPQKCIFTQKKSTILSDNWEPIPDCLTSCYNRDTTKHTVLACSTSLCVETKLQMFTKIIMSWSTITTVKKNSPHDMLAHNRTKLSYKRLKSKSPHKWTHLTLVWGIKIIIIKFLTCPDTQPTNQPTNQLACCLT